MTLCIAADCWIEDKPCLMYCCDTRLERGGAYGELVGAEDAWKIRTIGRNVALVAGGETPADRLLAICDADIKAFGRQAGGDDSDLLIDGFLRTLEVHAETRKKMAANHWLQFEYGFSLEYFATHHKTQFEPEMARAIWHRIQHTDLETDLLICGYQDDDPVIIKLDRFGKAHWETNYSAIGAGVDVAYPFLSQQDWDDHPSVLQCAYYLLQAKTAAEKNRHVGEFTYLQVLTPDGKRHELTEGTFDLIKEMVDRTRAVKAPAFTTDMLQEIETD